MGIKIVYSLNENGDYIGIHNCQWSLVDKDWLYPSYYTEQIPPQLTEWTKANFDGTKWKLEENNIARIIYNTKTQEVTYCITEKIPVDYTSVPPITIYDEWDNTQQRWIKNEEKEAAAMNNKPIPKTEIELRLDLIETNILIIKDKLGI